MTEKDEHEILKQIKKMRTSQLEIKADQATMKGAIEQHVQTQATDTKQYKKERKEMRDDVKQIKEDLSPILEERRDLVGAVRLGGTATRIIATIGGAIITLYGAYLVLRAVLVGGPAPQ